MGTSVMPKKIAKGFIVAAGLAAAVTAASGFRDNETTESDPLPTSPVSDMLEQLYRESDCAYIRTQQQAGSCLEHLNELASAMVLKIDMNAANNLNIRNSRDMMLHQYWIQMACSFPPAKSLTEFSKNMDSCLDTATKIAYHFNIQDAASFDATAKVLKTQARDAARQSLSPAVIGI